MLSPGLRVEGPGEEKNEDMYISEVNDRRMRRQRSESEEYIVFVTASDDRLRTEARLAG